MRSLKASQLLRQPPRTTRPREADVSPEQDAVCQVKRLLPREPAGRLLSSVVRLLLKHRRSKGTQKMKITSFAAARDNHLDPGGYRHAAMDLTVFLEQLRTDLTEAVLAQRAAHSRRGQ
jgi:hypothetical protein